MKTPALSLVLLSALAFPLSAQDSPLVVKTSDVELAIGMMSSFGSLDPLPDLGEGQHYVLTLGEDGFQAATDGGDAGLMQIEAKPGPLMQMFSNEIAQYQGMAQGLMMISMGQQGMKPAEVAAMVQGLMDFPNQVELLILKVTGDLYAPEQGLAAELSLAPKDGTWFASLTDSLTQVSTGAPVLEDPGAALQGTMGLGLKSTEPLEPIMALFAGMGSE